MHEARKIDLKTNAQNLTKPWTKAKKLIYCQLMHTAK